MPKKVVKGKKKEKYKYLEVTMKRTYVIPMHSDTISKINGWTMEEIIEDWFKRYNLDSIHATREGHQLMYATKFIEAEVKEEI